MSGGPMVDLLERSVSFKKFVIDLRLSNKMICESRTEGGTIGGQNCRVFSHPTMKIFMPKEKLIYSSGRTDAC